MLTIPRENILNFVRRYQRDHSIQAFTRVIPKPPGFASLNSAHCHLKALAAKEAVVPIKSRPLLRAATSRYADIIPAKGLECQGVLVVLLRRIATA